VLTDAKEEYSGGCPGIYPKSLRKMISRPFIRLSSTILTISPKISEKISDGSVMVVCNLTRFTSSGYSFSGTNVRRKSSN